MRPSPAADLTSPSTPETAAGPRRGTGLLAVLTNTGATRVQRILPRLRHEIAAGRGVLHIEMAKPADLQPALRLAAASGAKLLCVIGGDGTVSMLADALARGRWPGTPPPIMVLAGGHTNLIAQDLGSGGEPLNRLRRLLAWWAGGTGTEALPIARRAPIIHEGGGLGEPKAGFFTGLAGIPRALLWARRRLHRPFVPLALHDGASLLALAASAGLGLERSPLQPVALTIGLEDGRRLSDRFSVVIATPLPHLLLGARLFARHHGETIQFAAFTRTGPRLVGALMRALGGRLHLAAMPELTLERTREVTIEGASEIVIDGELFALDPDAPLVLRAGRPLAFVDCRKHR